MTRQIVRQPPAPPSGALGAPAIGPPADKYKDRLLKYIPADVVAIYLTLTSTVAAAADGSLKWWLAWIVFVVVGICTPFYMKHIGKITDQKQIIVGSIAFIIWAASLGAPFDKTHIPWFEPIIVALILPLFTFLIPLTDEEPP